MFHRFFGKKIHSPLQKGGLFLTSIIAFVLCPTLSLHQQAVSSSQTSHLVSGVELRVGYTTAAAADVTSPPCDSNMGPCPQTQSDVNATTGVELVKILNTFLDLLLILTIPLTWFAGWLMSPDWTYGRFFGMQPILHSMWVLVSNVVYFLFAISLVWIAINNILSRNGDMYEIKNMLPKFVVGIIIVPFTWWVVSFGTTIASIMTASVLKLPASLIKETQ